MRFRSASDMLTNARTRKYHATLTRRALAEYRLIPTTVWKCSCECGLTRLAIPVTVFDVIPQRSDAANRADRPTGALVAFGIDSNPQIQRWFSRTGARGPSVTR